MFKFWGIENRRDVYYTFDCKPTCPTIIFSPETSVLLANRNSIIIVTDKQDTLGPIDDLEKKATLKKEKTEVTMHFNF